MSKKTSKKVELRLGSWISLLVVILSVGLLNGCTSAKKLVYFQGVTAQDDTVSIQETFIPTIRKGDVLSVQVSSLNAEASAYFNPVSMADASVASAAANPLARTIGYAVADDGTIKLPLIGQLSVIGLTNAKAGDLITSKLRNYLKEPTVNVRNLNFRISVLGEVSRPALFTIPNEQITLPEALGLAGDLTIYGRRDNILIIREEGGKRVFKRLNLTQRDAFKSPYYSLHPNDVVYVEPGKARVTSVDRAYQLAPIITGVLSLIAIIATRR
ncbi:polysaccharide biosynthesis/export family protein [Spirosoma pollinicola]|uniref:Sugar transporter n=1 Tax=Spirosoma pollinicola TaxID=2057025 RepID=A0A2K8YYA0_9BACT|nr:polysaccharide biosynthesis/export family protein [Spirosoma pollinicola]AUD02595.1 sugar transporter [Spirosoma pollinicola]